MSFVFKDQCFNRVIRDRLPSGVSKRPWNLSSRRLTPSARPFFMRLGNFRSVHRLEQADSQDLKEPCLAEGACQCREDCSVRSLRISMNHLMAPATSINCTLNCLNSRLKFASGLFQYSSADIPWKLNVCGVLFTGRPSSAKAAITLACGLSE